MKQLQQRLSFKSIITLLFLCLVQTVLWAQDSGGGESTTSTTKTTITTSEGTTWYSSPWVWVVGAAVFILLLVALTRGGGGTRAGSSDRVTVTKEVRRDSCSNAAIPVFNLLVKFLRGLGCFNSIIIFKALI